MIYNKLYFQKDRNGKNIMQEIQWKSISDTNASGKNNCLEKLLNGDYIVINMTIPKFLIEKSEE